MTRRPEAGVTLLEVLIAVTLLAMLSGGMVFSMHTGMNAFAKTTARLNENRRTLAAQRILDSQLQGLVPAVALCGVGPEQPGVRLPFFQGEPQSMRFVSSYSLQEAWRGVARILEYQVIPRTEGPGLRLVVNELPYTGGLAAGALCLGRQPDPALGLEITRFLPIRTGPQSFVLADNLAACAFSYQESLPQAPFARWTPVWTRPEWPRAIRIEMVPREPALARIQPLTVTAPLHIDRAPLLGYVD
jgi:hypothetical protein